MNKPKKLPYEDYRFIYDRVPRLCVDLVIRTGEGMVLSKRDIEPGKGLWHMPGGTVLMGESLADARQRIAGEETGLSLGGVQLLGTMEFVEEDNPYFHTVSLVFLAEVADGTLRGSDQGAEIRFFKELPGPMITEQERFLAALTGLWSVP